LLLHLMTLPYQQVVDLQQMVTIKKTNLAIHEKAMLSLFFIEFIF